MNRGRPVAGVGQLRSQGHAHANEPSDDDGRVHLRGELVVPIDTATAI